MKYKRENILERAEVDGLLDKVQTGDKLTEVETSIESLALESSKNAVREIDIACLVKNPNNHFHRINGEQWDEFVGSIREVGILTPCIVRITKEPDVFEILAGHNRVAGAQEAGLTTVPCIVMDVDDVQASIIIGITNNQREGTTELEWGWTYRTTYEAMKKEEGRPKKNVPTVGTFSEGDKKPTRTVEILAQKYGVGKNTIIRKMRLTYLVSQLYALYEKKVINQKIAIDLSYLNETNQINVVQAVTIHDAIMTEEVAAQLKKRAEAGMSIDEVINLCISVGGTLEKKARPRKYNIDENLFPEDLKKSERESYIAAALQYISSNGIKLQ